MKLFLSHITEEAPAAQALKLQLRSALPGLEVFVSSVDVSLGDRWLREVDEAMRGAAAVLVLCSGRSLRRPWLNFESGAGWARDLPVITVCHRRLRKEQLPHPLQIFQGVTLDGASSCRKLVEQLGAQLHLAVAPGFDAKQMAERLRLESVARADRIGVVLAQRQDEWDDKHASLFELPASLPRALESRWNLEPLRDPEILMSEELHAYSGLVLGMPWRARLEPDLVEALLEWTLRGGRLLLLGFELGERHHGGNLSELSRHFGILGRSDIVGPPDHAVGKPYGAPVTFEVRDGERHPLTQSLRRVRLVNVQTLDVEPGGVAWLRVGDNRVHRPAARAVVFRDGALTMPREAAFEEVPGAGHLSVAVEAPAGLCGSGRVLALGSWDLLGSGSGMATEEFTRDADNAELLRRLLDWLAGGNGSS